MDTMRRTLVGQDKGKQGDILKEVSGLETLRNPEKFKIERGLAEDVGAAGEAEQRLRLVLGDE
jgi:hypothetical protein